MNQYRPLLEKFYYERRKIRYLLLEQWEFTYPTFEKNKGFKVSMLKSGKVGKSPYHFLGFKKRSNFNFYPSAF